MTDGFYNRAAELSNRLVKARNDHSLESEQYQHTVRSVLAALRALRQASHQVVPQDENIRKTQSLVTSYICVLFSPPPCDGANHLR
jgi:hypothetical protein